MNAVVPVVRVPHALPGLTLEVDWAGQQVRVTGRLRFSCLMDPRVQHRLPVDRCEDIEANPRWRRLAWRACQGDEFSRLVLADELVADLRAPWNDPCIRFWPCGEE